MNSRHVHPGDRTSARGVAGAISAVGRLLVLTSLLTLLIPVVAMAGAAVFLGEEVVAAQVVGAAVVLGALATVVWRRQPEEPDLPLEVAEQPL